ncbi:hypothetical protein IJU97_02485 [bacterium]|nr:hypothetical protein [bacterium]
MDFDVVRFLQQVYKVGKTIGLASDDFCLVFKLRFDSFFFNKIDFDQLRNAVQDENTIICNYPSPTWSHILGFNMEKLWEI